MKRIVTTMLCGFYLSCAAAQHVSGQYITDGHWDLKKNVNWVNLLRLNLSITLGKGSVEAATIHVAQTDHSVIGDWQGFCNIDAENTLAAIAVLGYMHQWDNAHLFAGVRNVNEDFFTSDVTALFINSSCGIFPTIAASYPIANYPLSGLTLYFDVTKGEWTFRNSLYNGVGYKGWKRHDNLFLVRPKRDGMFNISQLEYAHRGARYFAGVAIHSRQFPVDSDSENSSPDASCDVSKNHDDDAPARHTSCAWWLYGEQPLWTTDGKAVLGMVQYSENTNRNSTCYRYAEVGCAYRDDRNECGLSGQYARYYNGTEYSAEVTWKHKLTESIALQPSFQYISNSDGNYTVASLRLYCDF